MNAYVRILESNIAYDIDYTYIVPKELDSRIYVGVFVNVPFGNGNKTNLGVVTRLNVDLPVGFENKVKSIIDINTDFEPITEKQLALSFEISRRYVCSFSEALRLMTVEKLKITEKIKFVKLNISREEGKKLVSGNTIRNINGINVLNALLSKDDFTYEYASLLSLCSCKQSTIEGLKKKGYISVFSETRTTYDITDVIDDVALEEPKKLNEEQEEALSKLLSLYEASRFSEYLLRGVTGSGKTEVYLNLLSKVLDNGDGAILLVPEIALTTQMIERVRRRFGKNVAVIHSRLSDKERQRELAKIRQGLCKIVVGVRSAVFAPVRNLKLIIVDEEQEPSYKSFDMKPYYHAAEVSMMRMKQENGLVVYGSATPRVSTFYRAVTNEIGYGFLSKRALSSNMPEVKIVDMKAEANSGNKSPISRVLLAELHKNTEKGEQSILFVPRRGYSAKLTCLKCGKTLGCKYCHVPLSYHKQANRVICHYCGSTGIAPKICPTCGEPALGYRIYGTEMIEEELERLFPGAGVIRMDTDTTRERGGHKKLLDEFETEKVPFLIGTQMIAKGLDYPNVTLVGVINADSLLSISEYDAVERAFVLLTQVFGRAGRTAEKPGRCFLQTMDPSEKVFKEAACQDYDDFYGNEIKYRRAIGYPPFVSIATITITGKDDKESFDTANLLNKKLTDECSSLEVLKVARCQIPKINDNYRWSFVVKAKSLEELSDSMNEFYKGFVSKLINGKIKISIDMN